MTECYACAKLAELRAENNALRGIVGDMREDVAEMDDVIAVLKAERAELEAKVDELTAQLEAAYAKNRSLRTHVSKMQEGRHGWHVKGVELQREVDRLTSENISLARDLGECMAERDALVAEIDALEYQGELDEPRGTKVDINGEVVG